MAVSLHMQDTLINPGNVADTLTPVYNISNDTIAPAELNQADTLTPDTLAGPDLPGEPTRQRGSGVILDAQVDYSARDSIRFDVRRQVVHLYGEADLKYGNIHLTAEYVNLDFRKNELFAVGMPDSLGAIVGNPVFTEGDQSFESAEIRYNFETQKGRTVQVVTEEAEGFLHGDVVKIMESRVIHVSDGKYTTCDNPDPHFHISFNRAKIVPNDKIITSAPRLTIAGVRTPLILPFGFFPNTQGQASGIIIPSYGETNNRGFYLENGGFYWGISDYIDLSLRGDIYSRGSWAARVGSSYRKRYKYNGSFNVNYAINILGEENLPGYERNRDFRVVWNHNQDPKARPNSIFRANVNAGSSQYNRYNPVTTNDYLSNTFSSSISYSANWADRYSFSVNARHSQNTNNNSVDLSLPDITFSVARFYPFRRKEPEGKLRWYEEITMNVNTTASNQIRTTEEDMFTPAMFENLRNGVQTSIPLSHSFRVLRHFNLSNSINYTERWYFEKHEQRWLTDSPDENGLSDVQGGRVVTDTLKGFWGVRDFSYSSSLNTRAYGMVQFARGPVMAIRHVISPSLGFSLRPDFSDPFWGYYGTYENPNLDEPVKYSYFRNFIYGTPAEGRSGSLNFSVSNNLEMKVRNRNDTVNGERKIALIDNLTLSTSYDLARDSLNMSDIRISGRTRLFGQFDVSYSSTWSPYAADSLGFSYNTFLWNTEKRLLRLRNSSWSLKFNYNLNSKQGEAQRGPMQSNLQQRPGETGGLPPEDESLGTEEQPVMDTPVNPGVIDYSVPWSLRFSYSLTYGINVIGSEQIREPSINQSLNFSGDINLTPNWRIGFSSGYNFDQKQITYTSIDLYRDLHCWELLINWVPFGFRKSYNLTLRVKSSVLQDLKLTRRADHLDRSF
ncbi:MAG: putative LPS assembly protein LptD [Bacteroidota bacterium]